MYKANQNFKMAGRMVFTNDQFESIDQVYVDRGLVREVKVVQPEAPVISEALRDTKQFEPVRRGRKPKATA